MVGGSVTETGSYQQLLSHDGDFAQFLKTYLILEEENEDENEDEESMSITMYYSCNYLLFYFFGIISVIYRI